MNVDSLLKRYFNECEGYPLIEVFDNENIYNVYSDIVRSLTNYPDIELSVMQALSYCFYEVLDNVLTHSGKNCGTAISLYIHTNIELNPNEIVENRTDCESQFNEEFAPTDDLEQLW